MAADLANAALAKPPEKRKVGGSTPPLTTTSDQAKRSRTHFCLVLFANGFANTSLDRLGEDVPDADGMFAQHVRVDPQGYSQITDCEVFGV